MKVIRESVGTPKQENAKKGWREYRYKNPETGKTTIRRILELESPTFDHDLTSVLSKNIARAVRENRKLAKGS